ncbi:MAG: hypothetical protein PHV87_07810, partial [Bacilli bacterium]|nr:hypothetical protein [Bacilli bacterium]
MAQGPQQLKPKKIKTADIGVILIIILLIIGIFLFMHNAADKPDKPELNDFLNYAEKDRIKSVAITPLGGNNIGYVNVTGEYINDEGIITRYNIIISEDILNDSVVPFIKANKVATYYKKMSSVDWFSIIVLVILPILLVIGMVVFFMRSAGGAAGTNRAFEFGRSRARLARHTKTT